MRKQIGSSLLAAAASLLVIGLVAVGSVAPASAASEEDLAAPQGSFVSTMPVPAKIQTTHFLPNSESSTVVGSEEDLAAPHGSFVSTMPVPSVGRNVIRFASSHPNEADVADRDELNLATRREAAAASLE